MEIVWYSIKTYTHTNWNRRYSTEITSSICSQLILLTEIPRIHNGERIIFSVMVLGKLDNPMQKAESVL